jgi:hypothetical protein
MNSVLNLLSQSGSKTWTLNRNTQRWMWKYEINCVICIVIPCMVPRQSGCIPTGPFLVMIISHGCQWRIVKTQHCVFIFKAYIKTHKWALFLKPKMYKMRQFDPINSARGSVLQFKLLRIFVSHVTVTFLRCHWNVQKWNIKAYGIISCIG